MKVNGNDPVHTYQVEESGNGISAGAQSNIPIRLELASRIAAGLAADPNFVGSFSGDYADLFSEISFKIADRLIAKHNETCEGE